MIRIFYGNDRVTARKMIDRVLGEDYEKFEGENLTAADLDSLFLGLSIFGENRRILVKNLSENKELWEKLPNFLETSHSIVLWEMNFDKRIAINKTLANSKKIELKEFKLPEKIEKNAAFAPFDLAYSGNLTAALRECDKLQETTEAYALIGAMASQAIRKLDGRNKKAVAAVKILAKADMDRKSSNVDAWNIVRLALAKIANL